MIVDKFSGHWLTELDARAKDAFSSNRRLYLLIDGAFVPGLHRRISVCYKKSLFASLPGADDKAIDVSPFLTPFSSGDKIVNALLRDCCGWPMVSAIETPDSLEQLASRLSVWCIIDVGGQRFNFRFADTRRLPAIFSILTEVQRSEFVGPAVRWSYTARNGQWCELDVRYSSAKPAVEPGLTEAQFSDLVADSLVDEIMVALRGRGHGVFMSPYQSYKLICLALEAASSIETVLADMDLIDWCEEFWLRRMA